MKRKNKQDKKLKLMYVVQNLNCGGLEKLVVELAKRVDRDAFRPSICCLLPPGPQELSKELTKSKIKVTYMNKKEGVDYALFLKLANFFRQEKPDLLHTHSSTANFYASLAARMAGITNIVNTEHGGIYFETGRKKLINRLLARMNKKMVCVSRNLNQDLQDMGVPKHKLMVIPNGVDINSSGNGVDKRRKRKTLGLGAKDFVICTVGRLEKVKNQKLLLTAAKKVLKKVPEARIVIVGDGSLRKELENYAVALRIRDKVIFLGYIEDIAPILKISDCLVNCSVSETFGLTIIEAMLAEVAVIATNVGGVKEIVKDEKTGILVRPNHPDALAEAILRIKRKPQFAAKMISQAKQFVQSNYSIEKMVNSYEDLYLSCYNGAGHYHG
ncbi:glycosyltransferase [Candidatus Omnitrophota bacterium]